MGFIQKLAVVAAGGFAAWICVITPVAAAPAVRGATSAGEIGLYAAADFLLVDGACADCKTLKPALWYFRGDQVAVPKDGVASAGFTAGVAAQADVRAWYSSATPEDLKARPGLIWIGSPSIIGDARLQPSGDSVVVAGGSAAFFAQRPLRIRGRVETASNGVQSVTARTIWPQDYVIDAVRAPLAPLAAGETLSGLVRQNEANTRYEARVLWERSPGAPR